MDVEASKDDMGVGRAINLADRIEAATADQQRKWETSSCPFTGDDAWKCLNTCTCEHFGKYAAIRAKGTDDG